MPQNYVHSHLSKHSDLHLFANYLTLCVSNTKIRRLNTQTCCESTQRNECVHERVKCSEMGCFNLTCRRFQVDKVAMTTKYKEDYNKYPPQIHTHSLSLDNQREREKKRERIWVRAIIYKVGPF